MNFFLHGNEAVDYILLEPIREFRVFLFLGSVSFLTCSAGFIIPVMLSNTEALGEADSLIKGTCVFVLNLEKNP